MTAPQCQGLPEARAPCDVEDLCAEPDSTFTAAFVQDARFLGALSGEVDLVASHVASPTHEMLSVLR